MKVNVLGTDYTILFKNFQGDEAFERNSIDGYCSSLSKTIVICDLTTKENWKHETLDCVKTAQKEILRHEIVHAFFNESGLQDSTFIYDGAWSKCEEMVDWFALQGPKIYAAWNSVGAI